MPIVKLNWSGMDRSNMVLIVVSRESFLAFLKVLRECFATSREISLLSHVGTLTYVRRHALSPPAFQHFLFFNKLTMQQRRSEDTLWRYEDSRSCGSGHLNNLISGIILYCQAATYCLGRVSRIYKAISFAISTEHMPTWTLLSFSFLVGSLKLEIPANFESVSRALVSSLSNTSISTLLQGYGEIAWVLETMLIPAPVVSDSCLSYAARILFCYPSHHAACHACQAGSRLCHEPFYDDLRHLKISFILM